MPIPNNPSPSPSPEFLFAGAYVVIDAAPQILAGIAVAIVGVMQVHWYTNMHKREVFMTAICLSLVLSPIPSLASIGPKPTFHAASDLQNLYRPPHPPKAVIIFAILPVSFL